LTVIVPVAGRDAADRVVQAARSVGPVDETVYVHDVTHFVKARFASDAEATRFERLIAPQMQHSFRPLPVDAVLAWVGRRACVYHGGSVYGGRVGYEGVVQQVNDDHIRVMPVGQMGGLLPAPPPHADVRIDLVRDIEPR
jgi:hypothetical protein